MSDLEEQTDPDEGVFRQRQRPVHDDDERLRAKKPKPPLPIPTPAELRTLHSEALDAEISHLEAQSRLTNAANEATKAAENYHTARQTYLAAFARYDRELRREKLLKR
jgi:hypothetical protein